MDFYTFFPKILNMSLTASVAIVFVLLLRLLLKRLRRSYLMLFGVLCCSGCCARCPLSPEYHCLGYLKRLLLVQQTEPV